MLQSKPQWFWPTVCLLLTAALTWKVSATAEEERRPDPRRPASGPRDDDKDRADDRDERRGPPQHGWGHGGGGRFGHHRFQHGGHPGWGDRNRDDDDRCPHCGRGSDRDGHRGPPQFGHPGPSRHGFGHHGFGHQGPPPFARHGFGHGGPAPSRHHFSYRGGHHSCRDCERHHGPPHWAHHGRGHHGSRSHGWAHHGGGPFGHHGPAHFGHHRGGGFPGHHEGRHDDDRRGGPERDRCPDCEQAERHLREHRAPPPPPHGRPGDKDDDKDRGERRSSLMPGPAGPHGPHPGGAFGRFGGPPHGYRRNWDSPPDEKKADEKKSDAKKSDDKPTGDKKADEKKPAAKEPVRRPAAEPKSSSDKKPAPDKPSTPTQQEARGIDVEVRSAIRFVAERLVGSMRPLVNMKWPTVKWPTVSLSVVGSLLADEKDRPVPPPLPRDGGPGPGFGDGRRPDGPSPGGPSPGGHFFGPWGHFDPERFKQADPELYAVWKEENDLEKKTFELGEQYRRTQDAAEKEKLKQGLAEQVGKHFDVRQKKRELELKRFTEHLERMKASIAKRQEARESIVKERIDELTGEDDAKF